MPEPMPLGDALRMVARLAADQRARLADGDAPAVLCACCHIRARQPQTWLCRACLQAECDGRGVCRVQEE